MAVTAKDKPGELGIRFVSPGAGNAAKGRVTVSAAFTASINGKSDASLQVFFVSGQNPPREAGTLRSTEGTRTEGSPVVRMERTFDLPPGLLEHGGFELRCVLDDTRDYGRMELTGVSLALEGGAPLAGQADAAWAGDQASQLSRRLGALTWEENTPSLTPALYTSTPPGSTPPEPVFTFQGPDGGPLTRYYDPGLEHPGFRLEPGKPVTLSCLPPGPAYLKLTTRETEGLEWNGSRTDLGMFLPSRSRVVLDASGGLRVEHVPVYLDGEPLGDNAASTGKLARKTGEACLSCRDGAACGVEYTYSSAAPMEGLRLEYYPRVFADWRFSNSVSVSYSLDAGPYLPLESFRGSATNSWEGLDTPRVVSLVFPTPARRVTLRFELSGDGAQLWSSPDYPMRLDFSCKGGAPLKTACPVLVESDSPPMDVVAYARAGFRERLLRGR